MKVLMIYTLLFLLSTPVWTQVGIGTTSPDASSALDLSTTSRGLLAPRLSQEQRNAIVSPATGLLVYQTDNTPGFYYYSGSAWVLLSASGAGWSITGNSGTLPATNYIGTSDNQGIAIKTNNTNRISVDSTGKIGFNTTNPGVGFDIAGALGLRVTTNPALTNHIDNYNIGTGTYFRLTSNSTYEISGITGGYNGKVLIITNAGANDLKLMNEDSGSLSQNRILTIDVNYDKIFVDQTVMLVYDTDVQRWRVIRD